MAGYSGTPLAKKLGFRENFRVALLSAPDDFGAELGVLPTGVKIFTTARPSSDLILFFTKSAAELRRKVPSLADKLTQTGMLWIAWPKKSSGVITDLSFDVVQQTGLAAGLVDTKICAINEVWSGLRFVIPVRSRAQQKQQN